MSCCKKKNDDCLPNKNVVERDYVVCACMQVMYSEIVDSIQSGATSVQELSEKLNIGIGCGSCLQEIRDILKQNRKKN